MTSKSRVFTQLFKQKSHAIYWCYLIQLIVSLILSLFSLIFRSDSTTIYENHHITFSSGHSTFGDFNLTVFLCFISFVFLVNFIYLCLDLWQTEKLNHNQSWRLIPIKDWQFYLLNIASSIATFIYLLVLQAITSLIFFIIATLTSKPLRQLIQIMHDEIKGPLITVDNLGGLIGIFCLIILILATIQSVIGFASFSTKAMINLLPNGNKAGIMILRFILIVIVAGLLIQLEANISDAFWPKTATSNNFLLIANLECIGFTIITGCCNCWLFERFIEAKQ